MKYKLKDAFKFIKTVLDLIDSEHNDMELGKKMRALVYDSKHFDKVDSE